MKRCLNRTALLFGTFCLLVLAAVPSQALWPHHHYVVPPEPPYFGTSYTIDVGDGTSRSELVKELVYNQSVNPNERDMVQRIFNNLEMPIEHATIQIVIVTPRELGLASDATTSQVYAKAAKSGLGMVPEETAARLLLRWTNFIIEDTSLTMAMKPVVYGNDWGTRVGLMFEIVNIGGTPKLDVTFMDPNSRVSSVDQQFVFARVNR